MESSNGFKPDNLDKFPLTHEHIFRKILLYSDCETLLKCEEVCSTWTWWISSYSSIWTEMLSVMAARARSLAWSIDTSGVGRRWLDGPASDYVIRRLEDLIRSAKSIIKEDHRETAKSKGLRITKLFRNIKLVTPDSMVI